MLASWTLPELVAACAARMASLPAPANGQVRAVPDERTIRYYATLGLLDRPAAMRGRTALYTARHLAQVIAIKRLQTMGRSLAEIQALWPALDDATLSRMSGVDVAGVPRSPGGGATGALRVPFWKQTPVAAPAGHASPVAVPAGDAPPGDAPAAPPGEPSGAAGASVDRADDVRAALPFAAQLALTIELAPQVSLTFPMPSGVTLSQADVRALRAAAAPLVSELARRRLTPHARDIVGRGGPHGTSADGGNDR